MKIFALTDTHFGHSKLHVYRRPVGFEDQILASLGRAHGDLLIHCGDFCIGDDVAWHEKFMAAAKGFPTKILVRGNHDNKSDAWYYAHGWSTVVESFTQTFFGKHIVFSHPPVQRNFKMQNLFAFDLNIHGHLHGDGVKRIKYMVETGHRRDEAEKAGYSLDFHKDIAPEIIGYGPIDLERFIKEANAETL